MVSKVFLKKNSFILKIKTAKQHERNVLKENKNVRSGKKTQKFMSKYCQDNAKKSKLFLSQYTREAYGHKERKGHPQIAWKLEETVSIL